MSDLHPVRNTPPLPRIGPIKRDADKAREQPKPHRKEKEADHTESEAPLHIDEYA